MILRTLDIDPRALRQIETALLWYDTIDPLLADDFLRAVQEVLDSIQTAPQLYAVRYRGLRSAALRRFPYALYFRDSKVTIRVYALIHSRQHRARALKA